MSWDRKSIAKRLIPCVNLVRSTSLNINLLGMIVCMGCDPWQEGTRVSLKSMSPDGRTQVEIVEITGRLDRNFYVRLTDVQRGIATNIFYSPDEGSPSTERIVWSRDSSRLLLLGREFFVEEQGRMPDGQQLYLLYDHKSGNLRCNATQQDRYGGFNRDDLATSDWSEQIEQDR